MYKNEEATHISLTYINVINKEVELANFDVV